MTVVVTLIGMFLTVVNFHIISGHWDLLLYTPLHLTLFLLRWFLSNFKALCIYCIHVSCRLRHEYFCQTCRLYVSFFHENFGRMCLKTLCAHRCLPFLW